MQQFPMLSAFLSSTSSCCKIQRNSSVISYWLCSYTSLSISLLSSSSPMAKDTISFTSGTTDNVSHPSKTHLTMLSGHLLPSKSEGYLDKLFPRIFDHLEAGNDVEMIIPKFSESKIGL
ncbi:hypothetical protein AVEN_49992-1 [Araneus ventricosus]|uniref:Uncharacterized protein n=1 Tax=Araneus ventricosus TaxID=182803 RepID=A0A4Y2D0P3_ARAVE|nr:hypothetical protein AVEN_49992-1 [Araneus ventricosus]